MTKQPFDALFSVTFKIKSEAIAYIKKFFPEKFVQHIDFENFELDDTSYMDKELKKTLSDVVYNSFWKGKVPIKITLLFEHKSYYSPYLALQILRYMTDIWNQQINQGEKPSLIIPIILYHGDERFKYRSISNYFGKIDEELKPFVPNFEFLFTDLSKFSNQQLYEMELGILYSMLALFKHKRDWEFVEGHYKELFFYEKLTYNDYIIETFSKAVFYYLCGVHTEKEDAIKDLTYKLTPKVKDMALTIMEQLELKGEKKGYEQKTKEFVTNLISKFPEWSDKAVAELANVKTEYVKKIRTLLKKESAIKKEK